MSSSPTSSPRKSNPQDDHHLASPPPQLCSSLRWKRDILLMPLLTIAFGLQFYDKAILGSALLFGIATDLDLSQNNGTDLSRYSTATACFYYGYLVGSLPAAYLSQRLHLSRFLGICVLTWGAIVILTPAVTTYQGLYAQRIFLGLVESSVSPGFVRVTKTFYTRSEAPPRLGIWYSATGLFSIFSGLVNYGIGKAAEGSGTLAAWKAMYLFAGGITIFFGLLLLILLPSSPTSKPILSIPYFNKLSSSEMQELDFHLKSDPSSFSPQDQRFSSSQAFEALLDFKVWIFFLLSISIYVCNGGVTAFGSYIIKSFGYSSLRSLILQTPGGATTCISIYATTLFARRVRNSRASMLSLSCLPVMAGAIMIWRGDWSNRAIPLAGYYLLPIFGAPFVMLLSLATANIAGQTKQTVTSGLIFVGYCVGNIIAPYTVFANEKSVHYRSTFIAIIVCMVASILLSGLLVLFLAKENRSRDSISSHVDSDKSATKEVCDDEEIGEESSLELTDKENSSFRYVY